MRMKHVQQTCEASLLESLCLLSSESLRVVGVESPSRSSEGGGEGGRRCWGVRFSLVTVLLLTMNGKDTWRVRSEGVRDEGVMGEG